MSFGPGAPAKKARMVKRRGAGARAGPRHVAGAPPIADRKAAGPCGPPVVSAIACENSLPGDPPSDWQVSGSGDQSIQRFATAMSVNVGQTIQFNGHD